MNHVGYVQNHEDGWEAIVIADDATGESLELQRMLEYSTQDVALGQDTYCLVRGGATLYGGVERWMVDGTMLILELSHEAANTLELPPTTKIALADGDIRLIAEHLPRLLAIAQ